MSSNQLNSTIFLFTDSLLFTTIFGHWNCFLWSVTIDGKDRHKLKLEKLDHIFPSFNVSLCLAKVSAASAPW